MITTPNKTPLAYLKEHAYLKDHTLLHERKINTLPDFIIKPNLRITLIHLNPLITLTSPHTPPYFHMSSAHTQKDKISTAARVAISSGPAAAAKELRFNKRQKFCS